MARYTGAIVIGADHAGFRLKNFITAELEQLGIAVTDIGAHTLDPLDGYPHYAGLVAGAVARGEFIRGIAICGSGIGTSIACNRVKGVRAALSVTAEMARLSRLHNNANILVLGERITPFNVASEIVKVWLETDFEGGRHECRVADIDAI